MIILGRYEKRLTFVAQFRKLKQIKRGRIKL